jgi:hypothetical protein
MFETKRLVVIFSIERSVAVKKVFSHIEIYENYMTRAFMIMLFFKFMVIYCPVILIVDSRGDLHKRCVIADEHSDIANIYLLCQIAIEFLLPFVIIVVANVILLVELYNSNERHYVRVISDEVCSSRAVSLSPHLASCHRGQARVERPRASAETLARLLADDARPLAHLERVSRPQRAAVYRADR